MDTVDLLNELYEVRCAIDGILLRREELRAAAIPPEVRAALDAINAELEPALAAAESRAAELEQAVKAEVLGIGASVKGASLHAVYSGGRVTWDTRALDGYAAAHPEIREFRKPGAPSVSIRAL